MSAQLLQGQVGYERVGGAAQLRDVAAPSWRGRLELARRGAPAPWRRGGQRRRRERYYVGRRPQATEVYVVSGREPARLAHLGYRSTAPFEWGSEAPGAHELAFAILADATERHPTDLVCQAFCRDVVARLDHAGFVLADGDVAVWLLSAFVEPECSAATAQAAPGPHHSTRALAWIRSLRRRLDR